MNQHTDLKIGIGFSLLLVVGSNGASAQPRDAWEDSLTCILQSSKAMHLPLAQLENKIHEGRAKNRSAAEIYSVVKSRQQLLVRIRDQHQGQFPLGYTQQLFSLERSNPNREKTAAESIDTTAKKIFRTPQASVKNSLQQAQVHTDTASGKKDTYQPGTSKQGNDNERKIQRKLEKTSEKAEKTMEKAASRAEQRMNKIQRRLQKNEMKRRGVNQ
jgi:hypothetical protein